MSNKKQPIETSKPKTVTFTKIQIFWIDLMIFLFPVVTVIIQEYPPLYICVIWGGYWGLRLITTAVLHYHKKQRKQNYTFFDGIAPYINEDNAIQFIERYTGLEPKKK